MCILRGFLKSDELGSRGSETLRFEEKVIEIAVPSASAQQRFDVAVDRLHHAQRNLGAAVVEDSIQMIQQHIR